MSETINKVYLTSNQLTEDSFALARKIYDSGFVPDVLIALWRGGAPIGVVVHEFLSYKGLKFYHTIAKVTSYTGIGESDELTVENFDHALKLITPETKVLVVDDIFDSGRTALKMKEMITKLTPHLRFAMPYFKPEKNTTDFAPDFYVKELDDWVVFPHELDGLTPEEIMKKSPFIHYMLGL